MLDACLNIICIKHTGLRRDLSNYVWSHIHYISQKSSTVTTFIDQRIAK